MKEKVSIATMENSLLHVIGKRGMMRGRIGPGAFSKRGAKVVEDGDCVAIFQSIHKVMKAEKVLKGAEEHALKLFPAEGLPPAVVKAWRAVLPPQTRLLPVGGIAPDSMAAYVRAGAGGFGLGSALYRPGASPAEVGARAAAFAAAWATLTAAG